MWEMLDSNKNARRFSAKYSNNHTCGLCGTFFKKDDTFYIIMIPNEYKNKHKRLNRNMYVHCQEWDEINNGVIDDSDLINRIINYKKKKNILNEEEASRLDAFKSACIDCGFRQEIKKNYGVRMKKAGTSVYLDYNVHLDTIDINSRGRRGLFDSFYDRQIIANIYNKMHKIIGDGKADNYDSNKQIAEMMDKVQNTVKEVFDE